MDFTHLSESIDIVERVLCVYKQKTPILYCRFFVANSLKSVDRTVDYCLKFGT